MMNNRALLARKCAAAYLNLYEDGIKDSDIAIIESVSDFFAQHKQMLIMLTVPGISNALKWQALQQVFTHVKAPASLHSLIHMIVNQGRSLLLPEVLHAIISLYYERKRVMKCTIMTSHPIDDAAREIIRRFMMRQTRWNIVYTYEVNPSLIAGIRVLGDTVLWEYSIDKQLRNSNLALIR